MTKQQRTDQMESTGKRANRMKDHTACDEPNKQQSIPDFIDLLDREINDLKKEQEEIIKICAEFDCYLEKNAITPHDDFFSGLLREGKIDVKKDIDFKNLKKTYKKMRKQITLAMRRPNTSGVELIHSPERIIELSQKLFGLQYSGKLFNDMYERITKNANKINSQQTYFFNVRNFKSPLSGGFFL